MTIIQMYITRGKKGKNDGAGGCMFILFEYDFLKRTMI